MAGTTQHHANTHEQQLVCLGLHITTHASKQDMHDTSQTSAVPAWRHLEYRCDGLKFGSWVLMLMTCDYSDVQAAYTGLYASHGHASYSSISRQQFAFVYKKATQLCLQ